MKSTEENIIIILKKNGVKSNGELVEVYCEGRFLFSRKTKQEVIKELTAQIRNKIAS